ncbi:MAG TPA: polyprenol monophosphomannose synthase [Chitinophagaceae bacterium]|nr:polyprenol monophosphomannose synthase [Chitinophagaceae bacterium]
MEKLVVIPTYNEKDNIESILRYVFNLKKGYHILVVDDSSPDGTGDIVKNLQYEFPGLHLEVRKGKLGLGTAYIHGFKWGLQHGYEYIFEMDADFSHNPDDLDRLYDACKNGGADVAVGSRYVKGGKVENWPWDRNMLSKGGALYTRLITWIPVKDPTAGFMCYKREVLAAINLDEVTFVGYAFQIEMKFASWKLGFVIKEVPITFIDRKLGVSKMNKGIVKEGIFGVIAIQWQSMFKNYRHRLSKPVPEPVASNHP